MDPRQDPKPARRPTRLAFHASRIVIDIGVLLVLGAMSLPFITAPGGDVHAMTADGFPALLLVIPIFAITLIPDHSRPLPTLLGWLAMVLALAAFPYTIVKYMDTSTLAGTLGGEVATGTRILVFGTFVVVAGIAIGLARSLFRLPAGGTYPARSDGGTRRSAHSRRVAAGTAPAPRPTTPRVPAKSASGPDATGPAPSDSSS